MAGAPHLEAFLEAAKYYLSVTSLDSTLGREMCAAAGFPGYHGAWCAVFVMACASRAGILNEVIGWDEYATAPGVLLVTADQCDGEFIEGPGVNGGVAVKPIPGDLITFSWDDSHFGAEHGSHIGIVEKVDGEMITTIEGNKGGIADRRDFEVDWKRINMYVRPKWEKLGDNITEYLAASGLGYHIGPLYANKNDRHDMTMREVGYLDGDYKLSDNSSNIKISVINYTTVLGEIYEMFAPASVDTTYTDTSKLQGNERIVVDQLIKMGFNASASAAVTAAIYAISKIDTMFSENVGTVKEPKYAYGICGWTDEKHKLMKTRVGVDTWNTDLTGQVQFLLDDLSTKEYQGLVAMVKSAKMNATDSASVAYNFLVNYNPIFNRIGKIEEAKKKAKEIFDAIVITTLSSIGNPTSELKNEDGEVLEVQKSIDIPEYIGQSGIMGEEDWTSYSAWYSGSPAWKAGTVQRTIADMWAYQGCPCNRGIATLDGYYLVAVRPKFGAVGDVILVTLEDGTKFSAIIADEKGDDAGNEWGHNKPAGISLIEWQAIVTYNGKVQIEGASYTIIDGVEVDDWYKKKVVNITNYGSFLA